MNLTTERLILYPISNAEMEKLIKNEQDPGMRAAYSEMLEGCVQHPKLREWYAVWHMQLTATGETVGDFCFKGIEEDGMVEIGYGLRDGYCGKGYMTEALRSVTKWALSRPEVTRVEAETDPENEASKKVLRAAGYVESGEIGEEGPRFVYEG